MIPANLIQNTAAFYLKSMENKKRISIYLVVIIVLPLALISLPFISINITFQSRGVIRPKSTNHSIRSHSHAHVKKVSIEENKLVKKGDTLLVLELDKLENQITLNQNKFKEVKAFISDLTELTQTKYNCKVNTLLYQKELQEYREKLQGLKIKESHFKYEFNTSKNLYEKGVISNTEKLKTEYDYNSVSSEITNLKNNQLSKWQNLLQGYLQDTTSTQSELSQLKKELNETIVIASISGTIVNYMGIKEGGFVNSGEVIAEISPNENLIVECYVSPKEIGYLKEKMIVNFQVDAYNYNQWGLAKGKVIEIFNDVSIINDQPVFRVRCKLITKQMQLKNGFAGQLKKGMTLTGRFKVTERTLWQLLYDGMDDWLNPKINDEL
ncbi:MAG: hypothetical protein COB15_07675 [Flavobacteriales bacterium]|nr:MAG: hypothetical protein COB15_07675 [Flavobacteriales bacterium]